MKIALPIDRDELLNIIKELESQNQFKNISHLCKAVEQTSWAKSFKPKPITSAVVALRINQFKLLDSLETKPGKKGRQAGPLSQEHKAKLLAGRGKKTINKAWADRVKNNIPKVNDTGKPIGDRFTKVVDKVTGGSLKAGIKLMCLQCSNFHTEEIKNCSVTTCALYEIRPYK